MKYKEAKKIIEELSSSDVIEIRWVKSEEDFVEENNDYVPGCYINKYGFYVIGKLDNGD